MLLQVDLSQAELRVMAAMSGDPWMLNALQEGAGDYFDTHMMPICFPQHDMTTLDKVTKKELRVQIKTVVYGLAFGREAKAIARELGISHHEAQTILDNYLNTASRFAQWREDIKTAALDPEKRDMLVNPFGRRYQAEVVTGGNQFNVMREALSFLPQSTASDICLVTGIRVKNDVRNMGGRIVNIVHDALLVEGPQPALEKIGPFIQQEFRNTGYMVFGDTVPFLSEYSIADNWGQLL